MNKMFKMNKKLTITCLKDRYTEISTKGRHQNSPLRATNCFREMLVSGFCDFCGMSEKAIFTSVSGVGLLYRAV